MVWMVSISDKSSSAGPIPSDEVKYTDVFIAVYASGIVKEELKARVAMENFIKGKLIRKPGPTSGIRTENP